MASEKKKKKKQWAEVKCLIHGKQAADPQIPLSVRVGFKGIRAEKTAGCPICKSEKNKVAAQ